MYIQPLTPFGTCVTYTTAGRSSRGVGGDYVLEGTGQEVSSRILVYNFVSRIDELDIVAINRHLLCSVMRDNHRYRSFLVAVHLSHHKYIYFIYVCH